MPSNRSKAKPVSALSAVILVVFFAFIAMNQSRTNNAGNTQHASPPDHTAPASNTPNSSSFRAATNTPSPSASPSTLPVANASPIRIGAWNIEWLGKPSERSGRAANIAQSPDDLADYIAYAKVDALALAEIVTDLRSRPLRSRELEAVIESLKRKTNGNWEYTLFPGRADGDQLTGILWNTNRLIAVSAAGTPWNAQSDKPWPLPIPRARSSAGNMLWSRPPHAMKFTTGNKRSDFIIVPVHMKADYQGKFDKHRAEEARALAATLPKVSELFKDSDIIVIGDTNITDEHEATIDILTDFGLADLNKAHEPTHWQGGGMDRAFVPRTQPEFKDASFEVISTTYLRDRAFRREDFKERFSDHYIIVTTLRVGEDDD